jgi:hypothetical protein
MAIRPPLPTAPLQRGVYNVVHKITGEATGATLSIARTRARHRAERTLVNVQQAMQQLRRVSPPFGMGFGPNVIDHGRRVTRTTGLVAYVRAECEIKVNITYARR